MASALTAQPAAHPSPQPPHILHPCLRAASSEPAINAARAANPRYPGLDRRCKSGLDPRGGKKKRKKERKKQKKKKARPGDEDHAGVADAEEFAEGAKGGEEAEGGEGANHTLHAVNLLHPPDCERGGRQRGQLRAGFVA
eukprot:1812119-Rhodomonas_salina.1